jgi:nicotinamidase/pyrazinamidase
VSHVDVVGLATDYCVRASALAAVEEGYTTAVLSDMIAGVAPLSSVKALDEMRDAGVTIK